MPLTREAPTPGHLSPRRRTSRLAWRRQAPRGLAAAAVIAALAMAGCTSNDSESNADEAAGTSAAPAPTSSAATDTTPVGPACASLPSSGPGSAAAIADQPVATAAAQSPALSTLVAAVTQAGLANTLNNAQDITVFAPTNDAFAKIPKSTLSQVLADKQALTNILTYHVVQGRQTPSDLEMGTLTTLQGGTITAAKAGGTYTANDAQVLCGNLQTSNATVYLIDTVLMPKT
jgi:uncharacterized surface protein with fasciclin (FAS1) repeats